MEHLIKKLDEIEELIKIHEGRQHASLSKPKAPTIDSIKPPKPQKPSMKPGSKKDPVAVAKQIEDPEMKNVAMDQAKKLKEKLNVDRNGQWELKQSEDLEKGWKAKAGDKTGKGITDFGNPPKK